VLPSSDSDIYGTLRDLGLLEQWTEDEFLTRLASGRKAVKARDDAIRTSEAIVQILVDPKRPQKAVCAFEDGGGEAIQMIEALREACPDLAARAGYVDEAWEWDAYEDDDARDAGAETDERFGAPCLLTIEWKGAARKIFFRTLADLCSLLNALLREDGSGARLYVVARRGKGSIVLVLDEARVRTLNASGILQPDEGHLSIA
jgi:hypothetical protein